MPHQISRRHSDLQRANASYKNPQWATVNYKES